MSTCIDQIIQVKIDNFVTEKVIQDKVDNFLKSYSDEKVRELSSESIISDIDTDEIELNIELNSECIKLNEKAIKESSLKLESLKKIVTDFQIETDKKLAVEIQKGEEKKKDEAILKTKVNKLEVKVDNTEQYTRRETIEFHRIPFEHTRERREDPTNMIVNFCARHLDINITRDHISVCHRQTIEADKKRVGSKKYIPPIYCRFVNRSIMLLCLERKNWLKNVRNKVGQRIFLKENLTLERRQLWERVENELHSFRYKWVKDWKILVRKDAYSKPIRIHCEKDLDKLVAEQPEKAVCIADKTSPAQHEKKHTTRDRNASYHRFDRFNSDWPEPQRLPREQEFDWFDGTFLTGHVPTRTFGSRSFHNSSHGKRFY